MYDPYLNDDYSCCVLVMPSVGKTSSIRIMRGCGLIPNITKPCEVQAMSGLLFMNPEICAKLYNKSAPVVRNLPELITDATQAQEKNLNQKDASTVTELIVGPELIPEITVSNVKPQCEIDAITSSGDSGVEKMNGDQNPMVDMQSNENTSVIHSENTLHILNNNSSITCKTVVDSETLIVETDDTDINTDIVKADKAILIDERTFESPKGQKDGSSLEMDESFDHETLIIDDDLEKVFTKKEMEKFDQEAESDRFRYGMHVASFLANNTVAIMLMLDNKMVTGSFRQGIPDSSINTKGTSSDRENNTNALREQFQYADPDESGDGDHMLMSNTQGYLKGKKPSDARSKSFSNSVSEVFTEAFAKIEEMGQETRNKQFHKHFPDIPPDEIVINSYSCAYVKDILLQGRLYVSKNWLCFHSNIFGFETDVSIAIGEVKEITRERTALIVPNAIGIQTENEKYVFGSLMSRAATYKLLTRILQEYREKEGLEGVPTGSRESSINGSELDTPDSETVVFIKDDDEEEEEDETSFTIDPNSSLIKTTVESQRNAATTVFSKSSFGQRMKEMICAMSVFKSLLRTGSSFKTVPNSQLFFAVTFLLIVSLFISALLLSFKVLRLSPQSDHTSLNIEDQSLQGFLKNHERHARTVQSIQLLLEEHLHTLSKVQDSLQCLHKSAVSQTEPVKETKAKTNSDEL